MRFSLIASLFVFALLTLAGCGPRGPVNAKVTEANGKMLVDKMKEKKGEMLLSEVEAVLGPGQEFVDPIGAEPSD